MVSGKSGNIRSSPMVFDWESIRFIESLGAASKQNKKSSGLPEGPPEARGFTYEPTAVSDVGGLEPRCLIGNE